MPTLTLNINVTDNQATKIQAWWSRVKAQMTNPPATINDYLEDSVIGIIKAGVEAEESKDTIQDRWSSLTDDQRSRIKDIVGE